MVLSACLMYAEGIDVFLKDAGLATGKHEAGDRIGSDAPAMPDVSIDQSTRRMAR
jgi:hypothetical protein